MDNLTMAGAPEKVNEKEVVTKTTLLHKAHELKERISDIEMSRIDEVEDDINEAQSTCTELIDLINKMG